MRGEFSPGNRRGGARVYTGVFAMRTVENVSCSARRLSGRAASSRNAPRSMAALQGARCRAGLTSGSSFPWQQRGCHPARHSESRGNCCGLCLPTRSPLQARSAPSGLPGAPPPALARSKRPQRTLGGFRGSRLQSRARNSRRWRSADLESLLFLVAEYARVVASALQHPRHQRLREIFHWLQLLLRDAGPLALRLNGAGWRREDATRQLWTGC